MKRSALAALLMLISLPAGATNLYVKYDVSLTGLKVGEGALSIDMKDGGYSINGQGEMAAFGSLVSDGWGRVNASGVATANELKPNSFVLVAEEDGKPMSVNLALRQGDVTGRTVQPPQDRMNERVKVEDKHKRGIVDPLSAVLFPAPSGPARTSCNRTIEIYDGKDRYDVVMRYKSQYQARGGKKKYKGKVLVCSARYLPIAGHRPGRKTIQQLAANKSMEIHLGEIPGQPYMLLYKASLMTPVGKAVVQNVKFKHRP